MRRWYTNAGRCRGRGARGVDPSHRSATYLFLKVCVSRAAGSSTTAGRRHGVQRDASLPGGWNRANGKARRCSAWTCHLQGERQIVKGSMRLGDGPAELNSYVTSFLAGRAGPRAPGNANGSERGNCRRPERYSFFDVCCRPRYK